MKVASQRLAKLDVRKSALLLVAMFSVVFCNVGAGELVVEKSRMAVSVAPFDTIARTNFSLKNLGTTSVAIKGITSDCGCTKATSNKTVIAPGEIATVSAEFTIGSRMGPQKSILMVLTDDAKHPLIPLEFALEIPKAIELSANLLLWEATESGATKSLMVKADPACSVTGVIARSENRNLEVKVKRLDATNFLIDVAPLANKRNINATLIVEATLPGDLRKRANAFVRVR